MLAWFQVMFPSFPFLPPGLTSFVVFVFGSRMNKARVRRKENRWIGSCDRTPALDSLDRNSITLLNPPRLEYIRNLTSLLH